MVRPKCAIFVAATLMQWKREEYRGTNFYDDSFVDLLWLTISHAFENTEIYKTLWPSGLPTSLDQFRSLPIITRNTLLDHHSKFLVSDLHCQGVNHTSGTLGQPLLVPRSQEEVSSTDEILKHLAAREGSTLRPLGLSIRDNVHGIGVHHYSHVVWLGDPSFSRPSLDLGISYLQSEFSIPGCERKVTYLFMSLLEVLYFTAYLQRKKLTPTDLAIRFIYTTGFPLSQYWRQTVLDNWRCNYVHAYSLSEIFGQALSCDLCKGYHFDVFSFVEFLDPTSGHRVTEGLASIVATTLYPYTQMMPLIRYDTGDFAWVSNTCPRGIGFVPLGKRARVLFGDDESPEVFPFDVLEILSEIPWVKRTVPSSLAALDLPLAKTYGLPKFAFSRIASNAVIEIEVESIPTFAQRKHLEASLYRRINERRRILDLPVLNFQLSFDSFVPPDRTVYGCPTAGNPM